MYNNYNRNDPRKLHLVGEFSSPSSIFSYIAFLVSCVVISVVCELNRIPWNQNMLLQDITASMFCLICASLYVAYMIITAFLRLVLTYAGSHGGHLSSYTYVEEERADMLDNLADESSVGPMDDLSDTTADDDNNNAPEEREDLKEAPEISQPNVQQLWHKFLKKYRLDPNTRLQDARRHIYNYGRIPRSVIISSMYLGGTGAFLAILPLCMWDYTMSASFVCSLIFISCMDAYPIPKDFKADVDVATATRALRWMRNGYHALAFVSVILILWIDASEEIMYYMVPLITSPPFPKYMMDKPYSNDTFQLFHVDVSPEQVQVQGRTGLAMKWPLIFLSASSPVFLRAGGGGVGNFFFSLPPSQTLETGLPVSTVLAILVLCYHNPSLSLVQDFAAMTEVRLIVPLFVLCPLCLAAALAFILYGFKKRSAGVIASILLLILCIRQQTTAKHHLQGHLDWLSLGFTLNTITCMAWYMIYKKKVVIPSKDLRKWDKSPLLIKVQHDKEESAESPAETLIETP